MILLTNVQTKGIRSVLLQYNARLQKDLVYVALKWGRTFLQTNVQRVVCDVLL